MLYDNNSVGAKKYVEFAKEFLIANNDSDNILQGNELGEIQQQGAPVDISPARSYEGQLDNESD